jgi:hypothetical protein
MKKEIEFDFAKWGQEGISIYGDKTKMLTFHKNPTNDLFYGVDEDGYLICDKQPEFKMFEEIKPREFWGNVYDNGNFVIHPTQERALQCLEKSGETIKVREVLD